jgi:hypothetical protein
MREIKLLDRTQPQTLVIGSLLLYINAAFVLLEMLLGGGFSILFALLFIVLPAGGAYGVANSKKVGYYVAVAAAIIALLPYALAILSSGIGALFSNPIGLVLAIVPIALFLHPHSREYMKIWFS